MLVSFFFLLFFFSSLIFLFYRYRFLFIHSFILCRFLFYSFQCSLIKILSLSLILSLLYLPLSRSPKRHHQTNKIPFTYIHIHAKYIKSMLMLIKHYANQFSLMLFNVTYNSHFAFICPVLILSFLLNFFHSALKTIRNQQNFIIILYLRLALSLFIIILQGFVEKIFNSILNVQGVQTIAACAR